MSFTDIPYHVLAPFLTRLAIHDIVNYCSSHQQGFNLCTDDVFWRNKLDQDFTYISNAQIFVPSQYEIQYTMNIDNWYNVYKRWFQFPGITYIMESSIYNPDINLSLYTTNIIFELNLNLYEIDEDNYILTELFDLATTQCQVDIMNAIYNIGHNIQKEHITSIIYQNIQHICLPALHWIMSRYNLTLIYITDIAAQFERYDILLWLIETYTNIMLSEHGFEILVLNMNINMLEWLWNKDIYPYQKTVNYATELENPVVIQWFNKHGLYADEYED